MNAVDVGAFSNRLRKNLQKLAPRMARDGTTAWRAYDQDIPEFRYTVDRYGPHVLVTEFRRLGAPPAQVEAVHAAVSRDLGVPMEALHRRVRAPKVWGQEQYSRLSRESVRAEVSEGGLRFLVNLTDYLDVGLFMDHRVTRARVRDEAKGRHVLNLFCYTGSFTVYAAHGGATSTTSVDQSGTYLDWLGENLRINGLDDPRHGRVRADVLAWLRAARPGSFDLVVLDPPSFSTGGQMDGTFDVQRDHVRLLADVRRLLAPGGVLYFSNNFTAFQLDARALEGAREVRELTPASLPADFKNSKIHRCWRAVF